MWGDADRMRADRDGAAYAPDADRWRVLAPAPVALNDATAAWTGEEMVVVGALLDGNNASRKRSATGMAYDPVEDTWRELPPQELSPQASSVAWTGRHVLAWDYLLAAGTYDPEVVRWDELPALPLDAGECYPESALVAGLVLASYCAQGALFDASTRRWHGIERAPTLLVYGSAVSAGDAVLFAGAGHEGIHNALWVYKPPN